MENKIRLEKHSLDQRDQANGQCNTSTDRLHNVSGLNFFFLFNNNKSCIILNIRFNFINQNIKSIHHVESLKLLAWHNNFSSINYLTTYIQTYDDVNFEYSSILDYPDEDEVFSTTGVFKNYSKSRPYWKPLEPQSTRGANGTITYQLEIEGYYFYKTRDNLNSDDNNAGEYPVQGKTDSGGWRWFGWGEKQFDTITVPIDAIPLVGSCTNYYDSEYPITTKFKLKNIKVSDN